MTKKINSVIALGILILTAMACSFSTANLSEIKFGKDKDAKGESTTFKPEDEIFAVSSVNNASGKNKVKFRVLFDKVEGEKTGTVAYKLDTETNVEDSRPIWFNFSYPQGFIPGTYKAELVLTGEDGKELDRKSANFTVTGENPNKTVKPASDETNSATEENKDADDK